MTVRLIALSSQHDHVHDVLAWLASNGLTIEHSYSDLNEGSKALLDQYGLKIQPVLFDISPVNNVDTLTKFAEGAEIKTMAEEKISAIKAALATVPAPIPVPEAPPPVPE